MNKIEAFRKFLVDGLGFPDDDKEIADILWEITGKIREEDLTQTYGDPDTGDDTGVKTYCDGMPCKKYRDIECKDCPYYKFWHQEYKEGWERR